MKEVLKKYCNYQDTKGFYSASTSNFEYKLIKNNTVRVYFNGFLVKEFILVEKLEMFFKSLQ